MLVYVLTATHKDRCIIVGVYASQQAAEAAQVRKGDIWSSWTYTVTETEVID